MSLKKKKALVIRFSSFGDILQCMGSLSLLSDDYSVDFATKSEFTDLVAASPLINKVFEFKKKSGLLGLIRFAFDLKKENYDLIYDAHNNLRSLILKCILFLSFKRPLIITRSKNRLKRFFLFYLKWNLFPNPFKGMESYRTPLKKKLNFSKDFEKMPLKFSSSIVEKLLRELPFSLNDSICLAPSAAWALKRWPLEHFKKLIQNSPNQSFLILGGPQDKFCKVLEQIDPQRIKNLAGSLNLLESVQLLSVTKGLISADTGLLHAADLMGTKALALIGPTAFGHPTNDWVKTLEVNLSCRPCTKDGRGACRQSVYQKCMVDISPEVVASELIRFF